MNSFKPRLLALSCLACLLPAWNGLAAQAAAENLALGKEYVFSRTPDWDMGGNLTDGKYAQGKMWDKDEAVSVG